MPSGKANEANGSLADSMSTKGLRRFVGEIKDELAKVTWTSRDEMQLYIKVVVLSTLTFGFGVYAVDIVIQSALHGLGVIVKALFG